MVKNFVWNGDTIIEERDGNNNVTKRFFAQGERRLNSQTGQMDNFYYTRDHLGSVREVTDGSGLLQARYDYDAFGNKTVLSGTMTVDFGYAGYYYHAPSGLNLTLNRAYSPSLGRWLSRDPLKDAEMSEGPNLYAYIRNNPINATDPLGLCPGDWWDPRTWFNQGLTNSLSDTWTSLQDVTGDFLTGNWNRFAADAAGNPLGQTENNPTAYASEWTLLGVSFAASGTAAYALSSEVLASQGYYDLASTIESRATQPFLRNADSRWFSTMQTDSLMNGARLANTDRGLFNTLTHFDMRSQAAAKWY